MEMSFLVILLRLCFQILALPVYLLWFLGIWDPICKKAFPYFMVFFSVHYNSKMSAKKKELFNNLSDFASPSGALTILEIGTGTGTNFQFYPTGSKVICTDPNPNFRKFLDKNLSENPQVKLERCIVTAAEDLHQIPDASVDVVVCTLVLCSVKSIEGVLREVLRVLRRERERKEKEQNGTGRERTLLHRRTSPMPPESPSHGWGMAWRFPVVSMAFSCVVTCILDLFHSVPGGAFYFMEHVAGSPSSWSLFWQQIYDPPWQVVFDGCHLTRETGKYLEKAGFSELKLRHMQAPLNWNPARPHIIGYAVK